MKKQSSGLRAIPTNIITGFLGAGKTTTILSLLEQKPADERWAVLVNEFGEIGIDGALFHGHHTHDDGLFIREVPGGCMCCAGGVPMSVALNQLLIRAKPQRVLIEPTGLGHPKGVLEVLLAERYRDVLDAQKTVTLVDARNLSDTRFTEHETFKQQIDIADVIVGHKCDLYQEEDRRRLSDYIRAQKGPDTPVVFASHGKLDPNLLNGRSEVVNREFKERLLQHADDDDGPGEEPIPESGFLKKENSGEGFYTIGWRFSADKVFDLDELLGWLSTIDAERVKAVLSTQDGVISYNQVEGTASLSKRDSTVKESRIEIISRQRDSRWESGLIDCLIAG